MTKLLIIIAIFLLFIVDVANAAVGDIDPLIDTYLLTIEKEERLELIEQIDRVNLLIDEFNYAAVNAKGKFPTIVMRRYASDYDDKTWKQFTQILLQDGYIIQGPLAIKCDRYNFCGDLCVETEEVECIEFRIILRSTIYF